MTPDNTFKRTENCNYVIKLCHKLGLQMKGICGKDIEEGKENLTLGIFFLFFNILFHLFLFFYFLLFYFYFYFLVLFKYFFYFFDY